jgi:crossover junction endodeoxyribonuclease RusA
VTTIAFQVRGVPVTQGSKRAFVIKGTNRAVLTESGGQAHRDWRTRVAAAAQDAADGRELIDGPVVVSLHFRLPRPASAPKRKRTWPIKARSGDVDKLARCCLDAFTGVLFRDDSQVVKLVVSKDWGDPGAACVVFDLRDDEELSTADDLVAVDA